MSASQEKKEWVEDFQDTIQQAHAENTMGEDMTFKELTIEQWFELTPGQKAKRVFDLYVQVLYPAEIKETYHYKAGRDMKHLTDIFKFEPLATPQEVANRLTMFLRRKTEYLKGHPLSKFEWNEYAPTERAHSTTRQGITEEDVLRITGELNNKSIPPAQEERRYH